MTYFVHFKKSYSMNKVNKSGPGFPMSCVMVFFVFSGFIWDEIFVDIVELMTIIAV